MTKKTTFNTSYLLVLLSLDHFFSWDNLFTKNIPTPLAVNKWKYVHCRPGKEMKRFSISRSEEFCGSGRDV